MRAFSVRHADSQHLKVDDLMAALGCDKSTVVRAALWHGLNELCKEIGDDKENAIEKVAIANLKAR